MGWDSERTILRESSWIPVKILKFIWTSMGPQIAPIAKETRLSGAEFGIPCHFGGYGTASTVAKVFGCCFKASQFQQTEALNQKT